MHSLDFQIAPSSQSAQQQSAEIEGYVRTLQQLKASRKEREKVIEQAKMTEQVLTLSAVQSSATTITTTLVEAMTKEAKRLRKELETLVSSHKINGSTWTYVHTLDLFDNVTLIVL